MKNHTLGTLTWIRMMRFTAQSNQLSNEFLKRFDLTTAQFDVLIQIKTYAPITQCQLAEKVTVTQGGMSRMLARLEKEGLIERKQNWKTKAISLTAKGEQMIDAATPSQLHFQSSFFEDVLTDEEMKTLYKVMTKLEKHSQEKKLPQA
ncbi:MarR family transcriptional regulator [Lysinibacillus fusiformis]|uniref:MarR family winged helix-turn-helix transcriptional regulator n=2 Tax=Bacillaceae TaxID=186817 RepID=UPI0000F3AC94|nr:MULTISPECIES: MarR family transcriptional regulator [Lysinibacillus]EAZ85184.1 Transcriptional regulator, MarR family protein [Bacillus sp. B14905]HAU35657.1 MarR family transcriptional regulator [Lysinibacillus sp.]AJK87366.1 MarR family transcriptional regulator [Lysinibacillus fusiformis]KEK12450.1 MarR family transcriptional regulator [Lysinibacillus sphaericus]KGA80931.1 MarR family transcriptional regulator [Lysinibacillus fusiformis]